MNDGDVSGAIRILSSIDSIAPVNAETYAKLLELHPAPEVEFKFDDSADIAVDTVTESELQIAVSKFRNGSAAGLDGMRPQHFKDMLSINTGDTGSVLKTRLTNFSDLLLRGKAPTFIIPILYGAALCALNKKTGSIRPIACMHPVASLMPITNLQKFSKNLIFEMHSTNWREITCCYRRISSVPECIHS